MAPDHKVPIGKRLQKSPYPCRLDLHGPYPYLPDQIPVPHGRAGYHLREKGRKQGIEQSWVWPRVAWRKEYLSLDPSSFS